MTGILRAITGVGLATILYKSLAATQQLSIARVLGASAAADAFFLAQALPVLLAGLLFNALSTSTIYLLGDGSRPKGEVAGLLLQVMCVTAAFAAAIWAGGEYLIRALAMPSPQPGLVREAVSIQALLLPVLIFQSAGGVLTGVMLSNRRLLAPPFSMCLMYVSGLAGLWMTWDGTAVRLALGLAAGAGLQALALALLLQRDLAVRPVMTMAQLRQLLGQALPAMGCNAISTLLLVSDRSFAASFGPGQVASISYVYSLITLPTQILVNSVVGVSMPYWAASRHDPLAFSESVTKALALLSFALVPVTLAMAFGARAFTGLVLGSTHFTPEQIASTAALFTAFTPAIIGFAAKDVLTAAALAQGRPLPALGIGLCCVIFAGLLKWVLAPSLGIAASAAATSAGLCLCSVLLMISSPTVGQMAARYWRYSREMILAALPALAIGLAITTLTAAPGWLTSVAALLCYSAVWYVLGGLHNGVQTLRGRW